jgi:hypothetical protein
MVAIGSERDSAPLRKKAILEPKLFVAIYARSVKPSARLVPELALAAIQTPEMEILSAGLSCPAAMAGNR